MKHRNFFFPSYCLFDRRNFWFDGACYLSSAVVGCWNLLYNVYFIWSAWNLMPLEWWLNGLLYKASANIVGKKKIKNKNLKSNGDWFWWTLCFACGTSFGSHFLKFFRCYGGSYLQVRWNLELMHQESYGFQGLCDKKKHSHFHCLSERTVVLKDLHKPSLFCFRKKDY